MENIEARVENLLEQMTLEEKITMLSGSSCMKTAVIPRLGINPLEVADGPNGIRSAGQPERKNTVALPAGVALAATFDTDIAEKYGKAIALDANAIGVKASLGPGVNLMRTPLNGRNFEYYGEDPVLAGKIAAGYIRGCQTEKVAATPKHLALNNQEICRTTISSDADERTLRELYLKAFEIIVKESEPWMMMSSYNRINGTYASENGFLQEQIAKREWGFDGVMVSDWGGAHDTLGCMLGGLDLEMGGPGVYLNSQRIIPLIKAGKIPESLVDDKVRRVLRLLCRTGAIDGTAVQGTCGGAEQLQTAGECAENSAVLLKNSSGILPLNLKKYRKILVTGPEADFRHHEGNLRYQGGAGATFTDREVTPLAGLQKFAAENNIELQYIPTIEFLHNRKNPAGFLDSSGVKCRIYPDAAAMEADLKLIHEEIDHKGFLEFGAIATLPEGGSSLPWKFTSRITAELTPADCSDPGVIIAVSSGKCSITLDGRTYPEINAGLENIRLPLVPGKTSQLEIIYTPHIPQIGSVHIISDDPGKLPAAKKEFLAAAESADAVIFTAGRHHLFDKEGIGLGNAKEADIPDMKLPDGQDDFINEIAAVNPNMIVTLTGGSAIDVEAWQDKVSAILMLWYAGEAGGRVLADILSGKVNPSGRIPFSWAKNLEDYPCHANNSYPGNRDDSDPHTKYEEGIFIGYRHFDRAKTELRYPFGFGLNYSSFEQELVEVKQTGFTTLDAACEVRVKVRNTSSAAGREVIQIYTGAVDPEFPRPVKELKYFAKVDLAPGEEKIVKFNLLWDDFSCFHPLKNHWTLPMGKYRIFLAANADDIIDSKDIFIVDFDKQEMKAAIAGV